MKRYFVFFLVFTIFLYGCSQKNTLKSDLINTVDAYLDSNKISLCDNGFNKIQINKDGKIELIDQLGYIRQEIEDGINGKQKDEYFQMYDSGILFKENNRLYFSNKINQYARFKKESDGKLTGIKICYANYKVDKLLDLPDYATNVSAEIRGKFKLKYDFFPFLNDVETKNFFTSMLSSATFDGVFQNRNGIWKLEKITNIEFDLEKLKDSYKFLHLREGVSPPIERAMNTLREDFGL